MKTLNTLVKSAKITALVGLIGLLAGSACKTDYPEPELKVCQVHISICDRLDSRRYSVYETNGVITNIFDEGTSKNYTYDIGSGPTFSTRDREFEALKSKLEPVIREYNRRRLSSCKYDRQLNGSGID
ncbi:MAG TPA: hypothetical protein VJ461_01430 [Candidatus Nanoarchaeia archaeon]|nr:hypothetical protein [Candidatus Nanoarchaeia archaeon]